MTAQSALVLLQGGTFVALAALLAAHGDWRLAAAQACLAAVTVLVYL